MSKHSIEDQDQCDPQLKTVRFSYAANCWIRRGWRMPGRGYGWEMVATPESGWMA